MMMAERGEGQSEIAPSQRRMMGGRMIQQGLIDIAFGRKQNPILELLMGGPPGQHSDSQHTHMEKRPPAVTKSHGFGNKRRTLSPLEILLRPINQGPMAINPIVDRHMVSESQQPQEKRTGFTGQVASNNKHPQTMPDILNTNKKPAITSTPYKSQTRMFSPLELLQRSLLQRQSHFPMESMPIESMSMGPMRHLHFGPPSMGQFADWLAGGAPGVPQTFQPASKTTISQSAAHTVGQSKRANSSASSRGPHIMNVMQQQFQRHLCFSETPMVIQRACSLTQQSTSAKPKCILNMKCVEISPGVGRCCARNKQHANMLGKLVRNHTHNIFICSSAV